MNLIIKNKNKALRSVLLVIAALGLAACTNSSSVGTPQEGALRTGVYPNFGRVPHGETAQFTKAEQEQVVSELNRAKASQGSVTTGSLSRADIEARKRQLQIETDATLKAIETGQ